MKQVIKTETVRKDDVCQVTRKFVGTENAETVVQKLIRAHNR